MAAAVMLVSACGTSDEPASSGDELIPVTVGAVPILDVAPLYLGVEAGIFERHGLDVSVQTSQGGAAIIPAVLASEVEFGNSNGISLLIAASKGLDLSLISPGSGSTDDPASDASTVVVPAESPIMRVRDLEGKRVAVNALNNIIDTIVREAVRADGGDPETVNFVELPFPDMPAAVSNGQVDAAYVTEPFLTVASQQGARALPSLAASAFDELGLTFYFTSARYAESNPETVDAFTNAMLEAQDLANTNPDQVREIVTSYTQIEPSLASELVLPAYPTSVNTASLEMLGQLAERDGLVSSPVNLKELVRSD